jgi:hypothetical protein
MTTSKSKQEEALRFLDDLDSLSPPPAPVTRGLTTPGAEAAPDGEAADVLAFIDEITQKSAEPTRTTTAHLDRPLSRSGTPTVKKGVERVRVGTPGTYSPSAASLLATKAEASTTVSTSPKTTSGHAQEQDSITASSSSGWGWGSVWSTAAAALQQAKSAVDEQVKNLPNEQARKWSEGVIEYAKTAQLDKLGSYDVAHVFSVEVTSLRRQRFQESGPLNPERHPECRRSPYIGTRSHPRLVEP